MRVERNLRLLELQAIFTGMSFLVAVIVPYYRDRMNLTFNDFLFGEAFFAATIVLLDVPTGWLSDVWQRRRILALGSFMNIIGYGLLIFAHGLVLAVTAQVIIGVGISLMSGSNSATLFETLLSANREGEYRRREGRRAGLGLYGIAMASIVGSLAYAHNPLWPAVASTAAQAAAFVCALLLDEPERHRRRPEKHPVLDVIETTRYALRHPEVGMLLVFAAVMFCSTKMIMWSQQPYYMEMGLKESLFGILMAAGFFLGGFSSQMAHRLDGKVDTIKVLACVWGMAMAVCLGAASHLGWSGVVLLMAGGSCIFGIAGPRVSEAINRCVDSSRRATVLSTQSLLVSLLFIPLSRVMGLVSKAHGVQPMLVALAAWLGVAGLCLAFWARRRASKHRAASCQEAAV